MKRSRASTCRASLDSREGRVSTDADAEVDEGFAPVDKFVEECKLYPGPRVRLLRVVLRRARRAAPVRSQGVMISLQVALYIAICSSDTVPYQHVPCEMSLPRHARTHWKRAPYGFPPSTAR